LPSCTCALKSFTASWLAEFISTTFSRDIPFCAFAPKREQAIARSSIFRRQCAGLSPQLLVLKARTSGIGPARHFERFNSTRHGRPQRANWTPVSQAPARSAIRIHSTFAGSCLTFISHGLDRPPITPDSCE
jgi:hypothetical protein